MFSSFDLGLFSLRGTPEIVRESIDAILLLPGCLVAGRLSARRSPTNHDRTKYLRDKVESGDDWLNHDAFLEILQAVEENDIEDHPHIDDVLFLEDVTIVFAAGTRVRLPIFSVKASAVIGYLEGSMPLADERDDSEYLG
jgi:hypothetical protein